jgi:integrase/recombinase XerD
MTFQEALQRFLLQIRADGRSNHTIKQYTRHIRLLDRWRAAGGLADNIAALTHEDVARFFTSEAATLTPSGKRKRPGSMNALRTSVREYFRYLHESGEITTNPARLLRRAMCAPPPPRGLSDEDVAKLLAALDTATTAAEQRDRMLFRLMLRTGLRIGSALGLDVEDLDLERGEILVRDGKGSRDDIVFLPEVIADELSDFLDERTSGPVFQGAGGWRLGVRSAQRRFSMWLARAGIRRGSPHALRHTFAARLLAKTGDLALVQAALRHRSVESTTVYLRVSSSQLRLALE